MISSDSAMNTAVFSALCSCFSLDPASSDAAILIQKAYQPDENPIIPPADRDVVYYYLESDSDSDDIHMTQIPAIYGKHEIVPTAGKGFVDSVLGYRLVLICYGPHAESNARKVRHAIYVDGYGNPKSILRKAGIHLVPDSPQPSISREPEGSLWRERADVSILLRVKDQQYYNRETIVSGPEINVKSR